MPYNIPSVQPLNLPTNTNPASNPNVQAAQGALTGANTNVANAVQQYNATNVANSYVPQALQTLLAQKYNNNQDLINPLKQATSVAQNAVSNPNQNLMTQLGVNQTTPALGGQPTYMAPSTLANNMNSTASTDYANYMAAQQALTARTGTISQLLSQGANQYQGQVSAAQGASAEAQTAQQTAQQL